MASKTDFLELTLPENGEYVDKWDQPLNANFETIDDHLSDLNDDLVGSSGDTANLKGTKNDLQERLDVGLDDDGTLKLDTSEDYIILEVSKIYGTSSAGDQIQRIVDRFDNPESEIIDLRLNESEDRYGAANPTAVRGIGRLAGEYPGVTAAVIPSPIRGFTPNSVVRSTWNAGPPPEPLHFIRAASDALRVQAGSVGAWYNIDGMLFRLMGDLEMDFTASGHDVSSMGDGTYHAFVSRAAGDYNSSSSLQWYYSRYNGQIMSGGPYRLDPRILPTHPTLRADADTATDPTDGSVTKGSSTLNSATAEFNTYGAERGDICVVTSPTSLAGRYVVGVLGGNTQIHMVGEFNATSSAVTFHLERPTVPSFGFVSTAGSQPYVEGRLYVGTFIVSSGAITSGLAYAPNGIFDSHWIQFGSFNWASAQNHYLGVPPSQVEVWVKDSSGNFLREPTMHIDVEHVDEKGGGVYSAQTIEVPAIRVSTTSSSYTLSATNPLAEAPPYKVIYDPNAAAYVESDSTTYSIRVILRR